MVQHGNWGGTLSGFSRRFRALADHTDCSRRAGVAYMACMKARVRLSASNSSLVAEYLARQGNPKVALALLLRNVRMPAALPAYSDHQICLHTMYGASTPLGSSSMDESKSDGMDLHTAEVGALSGKPPSMMQLQAEAASAAALIKIHDQTNGCSSAQQAHPSIHDCWAAMSHSTDLVNSTTATVHARLALSDVDSSQWQSIHEVASKIEGVASLVNYAASPRSTDTDYTRIATEAIDAGLGWCKAMGSKLRRIHVSIKGARQGEGSAGRRPPAVWSEHPVAAILAI